MEWSLRCENMEKMSLHGSVFLGRCHTDSAGLTMEETIEFATLDALPPFDDSGNIAC